MALKQNKAGAGHRFFCGWMVQGLCLLCMVPVITAQILLPDQGDVPTEEVQAAKTEIPDSSNEEDVQRMIQQMQNNQGRMLQETPLGPKEPEQALLEAAERRYETAVEIVRVFGQLISGETFQGELKNRSFLIENKVGRFPLRLGEIQQCRRMDTQDEFVFDLRDGDRISGRPKLDLLLLQMPEGGARVLLFRDILKVDFIHAP